MENHELDRRWIVERFPDINENGINAFQEKVGILMADYLMSEYEARQETLFIMTGRSF